MCLNCEAYGKIKNCQMCPKKCKISDSQEAGEVVAAEKQQHNSAESESSQVGQKRKLNLEEGKGNDKGNIPPQKEESGTSADEPTPVVQVRSV